MKALLLFIPFCVLSTEWAFAENVLIGRLQARGILNIVANPQTKKTPIVVLFPGSGAMGPEVRFPGYFLGSDGQRRQITTDGLSHSLFKDFTDVFNKAGISTLAVGKPGVDHSDEGAFPAPFYDQSLFASLTWSDWVTTAREAIAFARRLPGVDADRVYILGHSESTQMVADYAVTDQKLAGVILLGVLNDSFALGDAYQVFETEVDQFIARSVDANHDGFVDRAEAAHWPNEFNWSWREGESHISLTKIKASYRADPRRQEQYRRARFRFREEVYDRPVTLAQLLVPLRMSLYVFTGELDVMTVPAQAEAILRACQTQNKENCEVQIVPGLGHGFSPPIGPRSQPFLDWSFGPVAPEFRDRLRELARKL